MHATRQTSWFSRFATWCSRMSGRPGTFLAAALLLVGWALSGPFFGFSDTWQLVINTTTTIVTFLMVFLIQNTQNRDAEALQVKLDELIRVTEERELDKIRDRYKALAKRSREDLRRGKPDTHVPEL
jgi:low affinity Fe/Cu permease